MIEQKFLMVKVSLFEHYKDSGELLGSWVCEAEGKRAFSILIEEINYTLSQECDTDEERKKYEWRLSFGGFLTREEIINLPDFGGY